jgi:hypothetical protein
MHLGNIMCGGHFDYMVITTFYLIYASFIYQNNVNCVWLCRFYLYNNFISSSVCLVTRAYGGLQTIVSLNPV